MATRNTRSRVLQAQPRCARTVLLGCSPASSLGMVAQPVLMGWSPKAPKNFRCIQKSRHLEDYGLTASPGLPLRNKCNGILTRTRWRERQRSRSRNRYGRGAKKKEGVNRCLKTSWCSSCSMRYDNYFLFGILSSEVPWKQIAFDRA